MTIHSEGFIFADLWHIGTPIDVELLSLSFGGLLRLWRRWRCLNDRSFLNLAWSRSLDRLSIVSECTSVDRAHFFAPELLFEVVWLDCAGGGGGGGGGAFIVWPFSTIVLGLGGFIYCPPFISMVIFSLVLSAWI